MPVNTAAAAKQWLAEADTDPSHAARWWDSTGVVLLPVGVIWDAVKTGEEHGRRALEAAAIDGPVIYDPRGGSLYILVPTGTAVAWQLQDTECLSSHAYLPVPKPSRVEGPGPYWVQPPDANRTLVDPAALRAALEAAS